MLAAMLPTLPNFTVKLTIYNGIKTSESFVVVKMINSMIFRHIHV